MTVNALRTTAFAPVTRGLTALFRHLKAIGVGLVITALALTGAQFTALGATAAGGETTAGGATPAFASGIGSISGTVTDNELTAIEGVGVYAFWLNPETAEWEQSVAFFTDAEGGYTADNLPDGTYNVQFLQGDNPTPYVEQWYPNLPMQSDSAEAQITVLDGEAITGIDATLVAGNSISGNVTNALQAGIAGIYVRAELYDSENDSFTAVDWTETDGSGDYTFTALSAGSYAIAFDSPSDATTRYQSTYYLQSVSAATAEWVIIDGADQTGIDVQLSLFNKISGTVKDSATTPKAIAGVIVRAQAQLFDEFEEPAGIVNVAQTTTSSTGAYTFASLPDGDYALEFSSAAPPAAQYLTEYFNNQSTVDDALATPISVKNGAIVTGKNVNLVPAASITGSLTPLVEGEGISANDAWVSACTANTWGYLDCSFGRGSIATNGTYTVTDLPAGTYGVYVQYNGSENLLSEYYSTTSTTAWDSDDATNIVVAAAATASGKNIALNAGATISGTVTRDSLGVETEVTAYEASNSWFQEARRVSTDVEGSYTIDKLLPGKYLVQASGGSGEPAAAAQWNGVGESDVYSERRSPRIVLSVGTSSHTDATASFALGAAGMLSGRVLDSTGQTPLADVEVTATRFDSAISTRSNQLDVPQATSDSEGQYSFINLAPGYYTISYTADGFLNTQFVDSETQADRILVSPAEPTSVNDVTLRHSGTITGLVTDSEGVPLADVVVSDSLESCDWCGTTTTTDQTGHYSLSGFDPTVENDVYLHTYNLDLASTPVTYEDSSFSLPIGALSAADEGPIELDTVVLRLSSIVKGKVTDSAGVEQVGMTIQAVLKDPSGGHRIVASTTSASKGSYTLTDVPEGAVLYFASDPFTTATWAKFASQYDGGTTNINLANPLMFPKPGATIRRDIALLPTGSITGTIKKGTAALNGITVTAFSVSADNPRLWVGYGQAVTNSSGVYTIPGLAQGSYTVSFNDRTSGSSVTVVETSVGKATATAIVPLNAAVTSSVVLLPTVKVSGTVSATISGVANTKLAGVMVTAYPWSGTSAGSATQGDGYDSVSTDGVGNYSLLLTAGKYVLKFQDPQGRVSTRFLGGTSAPVGTNALTVATAALTGKNITLVAAGATLTATVVTQNGDAAEGYLTLDRVDGTTTVARVISSSWDTPVLNDAFPLRNVENGTYRLEINANGNDTPAVVSFTVAGNIVTTYSINDGDAVTGEGGNLQEIVVSEFGWPEAPALIGGDTVPMISVVGGSDLMVGSLLQSGNSEDSWTNSSGQFDYQWLRNGMEIAGATSEQYLLAPGDAGATISLRISARVWWDYTTASTEIVEPGLLPEGTIPVITAPFSLSGSLSVGQTATATAGVYEGIAGLTYSYQWVRGFDDGAGWTEEEISGATKATYLITTADLDTSVAVKVLAKRPGYLSDERVSNPIETIVAATLPSLKRTVVVAPTKAGNTYTAKPGTWTPSGARFTYDWLTLTAGEVTPLHGGSTTTFTPPNATVAILLRTTATKAGSATTTVQDVVRAGSGLVVNARPEVGGTGAVGSALAVSPSSNVEGATYTYQWVKSTTAISAATTITGATKASYEPVAADAGKFISVKITAKAYGFANSAVVASTPQRITATTAATLSESPELTGTYVVGRTLGVDLTGARWTATPTSFTYKWTRAATYNGTYATITGATAAKYTLVAADLGKFVKVVLTPVRAGVTYPLFTSWANEAAVSEQAVTNVLAPSIPVVAKVGTALTANPGTWDIAGATFTYQWLVNGQVIPGATATTYTPNPDNLFEEISVQVFANKATFPSASGSEVYSNQVTVMRGSRVVATALPTIKVDSSTVAATSSTVLTYADHTLNGTSGTWPAGTRSIEYQWQYQTDAAEPWSNIMGENNITLVMHAGEDSWFSGGYKYRLLITAKRAGYETSTASSVIISVRNPS